MSKLPVAPPPAAGDEPLLSVRGLGVSYDGRAVLADVDLDVRAGRVLALVGPSGCGKTSFLTSLNRLTDLVPGCTVEGLVRVAGEVVDDRTDRGRLRRRVGMVFQRPNPFPVSIRRNLHLPLREHGTPRAELDLRTEEVLRRVGLWDEVAERLDEPATRLSGGQQQRLCLARALTLSPRLLLMDEPCSALDPRATERIEALIRALRESVTVVLVTHNLGQARRVADDLAVFWCEDGCGRLLEVGEAASVFGAPRHPDTAAYLAGTRG